MRLAASLLTSSAILAATLWGAASVHADPLIFSPTPASWKYSIDASGNSIATYTGGVSMQGMISRQDNGLLLPADTLLKEAFADTKSTKFILPPGNFQLTNCPVSGEFNAASGITIVGSGPATVIKFPLGCNLPTDTFLWNGVNGAMENLTLDLNTPISTGALRVIVSFRAYSGNVTSAITQYLNILNASSEEFVIGGAANSGFSLTGFVADHNYIQMAPATSQNQCIALTTVNGAGTISDARITNNTCNGSAIQLDGARGYAVGNDVYGFKFGEGIFAAYDTGTPSQLTSDYDCIISNNLIHSTSAGLDVNNTAFGGIENNCFRALVSNNSIHGLGGPGILNYASEARIIGNHIYDNGSEGNGGAVGLLTQSGIALNNNGSGNAVYTSQNVTVTGNVAYDDQSVHTQLYGYAEEQGGNSFSSKLCANDFRQNGTQGYLLAAPVTGAASENCGPIYSLSNVALTGTGAGSIAFTGIDPSAHRISIVCRDITPQTVEKVYLQVGEGSGPTWETASYTVQETVNTGAIAAYSANTLPAIPLTNDTWSNDQSAPGWASAEFSDPGYLQGWKIAKIEGSFRASVGGFENMIGTGGYVGDTNPITAFRLITSSGDNILGACRLDGWL